MRCSKQWPHDDAMAAVDPRDAVVLAHSEPLPDS
jgi:hypothetical protein